MLSNSSRRATDAAVCQIICDPVPNALYAQRLYLPLKSERSLSHQNRRTFVGRPRLTTHAVGRLASLRRTPRMSLVIGRDTTFGDSGGLRRDRQPPAFVAERLGKKNGRDAGSRPATMPLPHSLLPCFVKLPPGHSQFTGGRTTEAFQGCLE